MSVDIQIKSTLVLVRTNPYFAQSRREGQKPMIIEETSTITAKGQTTVPKAVRQALGIDCGGKIAYRIEDGQVTVHNPEAGHRDPALTAFLRLLENDIAAGRNLRDLPAAVATSLRRAMKEVPVDLDERLEGETAL
jgi:antitoxin PrlF